MSFSWSARSAGSPPTPQEIGAALHEPPGAAALRDLAAFAASLTDRTTAVPHPTPAPRGWRTRAGLVAVALVPLLTLLALLTLAAHPTPRPAVTTAHHGRLDTLVRPTPRTAIPDP